MEVDSGRAATALEHELASKSVILLMKLELSEARIVLDRLKYRRAFCTIALAEKIENRNQTSSAGVRAGSRKDA